MNKTPNLPTDPDDGPSIAGAPNTAKIPQPPHSAATPAACDADFMNQIYTKAFLEAQREIVYNEAIIRKPDSILEYTCFNQLARGVIDYAAPLFSESTHWQNKVVPIGGYIGETYVPSFTVRVYMGPGAMTRAINTLVQASLAEYISKNFSHTFLGGAAGLDYVASAGFYSCNYMERVFDEFAKCNNTGEGFNPAWLNFSQLIMVDPRTLPLGTTCPAGTKITQTLIDITENKNFDYVNFDKVDPTRQNYLEPSPCLPPIPTGVIVLRETVTLDQYGNQASRVSSPYPDKFCPNPSCYYNNTADRCAQ